MGLLLIATLGATALPLHADEARRNEMKGQIERLLQDIAGELRDVPGDSSTSDLERTLDYASRVADLADDLEEHVEGDSDAGTMASYYESYASRYRSAAAALVELKRNQKALDELPRQCEEKNKELTDSAFRFVQNKDAKGVDEIPKLAAQYASTGKANLDLAESKRNEMTRWADQASGFSESHGYWSSVSSNLRSAASSILDHFQRRYDYVRQDQVCGNLAKGVDHPAVREAMAKLGAMHAESAAELARIRADAQAWQAKLQEIRKFFKEDVDQIRNAMCLAKESPGDSVAGAAVTALVNEVAEKMKSRIAGGWDQIDDPGNKLVERLDTLLLVPSDPIAPDAKKLRDELFGTLQRVERFMVSQGVGQGAQNPRIRTPMEVGKAEHVRIQGDSSKCTKSEITVGSNRIDCVRVAGNTCYLVEIKPNNSDAKSKGEEQLNRYITAVADYAKGKTRKDEFTGEMDVFRACFDESNASISLAVELRLYEFCPPAGQMFEDFVAP